MAAAALLELHRRGERVHVTPKNLIEFRNAATRPTMVNGLGLTPTDVETLSSDFLSKFPLLADTPDVFPAWKALVESVGVVGKQVHDARMAGYGPGQIVVEPASI